MTRSGKTWKSILLGGVAFLMTGTLVAAQITSLFDGKVQGAEQVAAEETPLISDRTGTVDLALSKDFDESVVAARRSVLPDDREVSYVVKTSSEGVYDAYAAQSSLTRYTTVADYALSSEGRSVSKQIAKKNGEASRILESSGVKFTYGAEYDVLLGGFEIVAKAGDYEKLARAFASSEYEITICEEYERCESLVVNDVNVDESTGIFDSEGAGYDGSGTVIAVLDTGLDYTHTAFDPDSFSPSEPVVIDPSYIEQRLPDLVASRYTPGLKTANLYQNRKVPFTYDYADKDADVYPLESPHGTHVSGVIVGNDNVIRGVAPNAQLVSMKVFSDTTQGARWSWLLGALEDCVVLGVDVINMSLGSSAGFSVESDEEQRATYDKVAAEGISLVAAASNDYNSTYGSEKNGNLGLTTNPDSATVGSPGSYTSTLAVASISGVKTPYLTYKNQIMYFTEAADQSSEPKDFVDDILPDGVNEKTYDYVVIPGIGRSTEYNGKDVEGKIALVRRGSTTFEEKARIAAQKGAAGIIIYNNVSGDISMNVGSVTIAACSISQDNGEILRQSDGKITISRTQVAGPFMSNFSSWGPTPDLRIKPEITAHGGEIYSAVPGQKYDRMSGTSMAAPNQAGVTALVRQYVKNRFPELAGNPVAVMARTNQIMMSTADIAHNIIDLPYSVRKQGAGLANLTRAISSPAYISAFARSDEAVAEQRADRFTDEVIDKAKIEYGDDKAKSGKYDLKFNINNVGGDALTYDVDAIVMTEGVSETKTHQGDLTVTEEGYELKDAVVTVTEVSGGTKGSGNAVSVPAYGTATVIVHIEIPEGSESKEYLDKKEVGVDVNGNEVSRDIFANGMFIEGYVTLKPSAGTEIPLNVPYLAFYGDWTQAPLFDLDYFETDKDARDDSIDLLDKTLPDAYATLPVGGLYSDYISQLGSYYFVQDPSSAQVSADRNHIALTNQTGDSGGVNSIYAIYAGMLRAAKSMKMTITDTTTGKVVWEKTEYNQRKSYSSGASIRPSFIDVDFNAADYDLKNNTQYLFRAEGILDFPGEQSNTRNVFEFPFVADFQAPVVTGVEFYTEYEESLQTLNKTRLFARVSVYDNHYAMSANIGQLVENAPGSQYTYSLNSFSRYYTPVFSSLNSTSEVTFELTDYVARLRDSFNPDTFTVTLNDYALNTSVYEIRIPDEVKYLYFEEMDGVGTEDGQKEYGVTLSPNQVYLLDPVCYPSSEWKESLTYTSDNQAAVKVVNGKLFAVAPGEATVTAVSASDGNVRANLTVKVLAQGEPGFTYYSPTIIDEGTFALTGYHTDYAYYFLVTSDRDIGLTGYDTYFSRNATAYALSMFPTEKVTILHELSSFDEAHTRILYESGDSAIATVNDEGQIVAVKQGATTVTVRVMSEDANGNLTPTMYERSINITVKDPYERNGPYLTAYRGGGGADGVVSIDEALGFTEISQFAFSGYEYIPKDLAAGDEISEEDPSATKIWYYGENQDVKVVIIPEGVETIGNYAFAGMKGLESVYLPTTLTKISTGAFYGCTSLQTVYGLENVQFVNQSAFWGPEATDANGNGLGYRETVPLSGLSDMKDSAGRAINPFASIVAIGDAAFRGTGITEIVLPASAQSIGAYAFADSTLMTVSILAEKIKLGAYAFAGCGFLYDISTVNSAVIGEGAFLGCSALSSISLGKDVENIGEYAFAGTSVSSFTVEAGNPNFAEQAGGNTPYLLSADGTELVYVAPIVAGGTFTLENSAVKRIGIGAFAGHRGIRTVSIPSVTAVEENAFRLCADLTSVTLGKLEEVGPYAFFGTQIRELPAFADGYAEISDYAFAQTDIAEVVLGDGIVIGEGAFADNDLETLTIGNNAKIGAYAFAGRGDSEQLPIEDSEVYTYIHYVGGSHLKEITIGTDAVIGEGAFAYLTALERVSLGSGAVIGDMAFFSSTTATAVIRDRRLTLAERDPLDIDLHGVKSVGDYAFSGDIIFALLNRNGTDYLVGAAGYQAPQVHKIDLSSADHIGVGAFAYGDAAEELILGEQITAIPDTAFAYNHIAAIDFRNVVSIGTGAFYHSDSLEAADLSGVDKIGLSENSDVNYGAFENSEKLARVTLKEGAIVGDFSFEGDGALVLAEGLSGVVSVVAHAFSNTALSGKISLVHAYAIGDFAFQNTAITEAELSEELAAAAKAEGETDGEYELRVFLGENPFAGCPLLPFSKEVTETVHGDFSVTETVYDYKLTADGRVQVIGGALYKTLPNGTLCLVSYPAASDAKTFTVADGTVRISAQAFRGSENLEAVTLPDTLLAIGDKAFYACDSLRMVTFRSIAAPILEEQYDESYAALPLTDEEGNAILDEQGRALTNLPSDPGYQILTRYVAKGLGIIKYDTLSFGNVNFFYGATFVDYIGHFEGDLVMVRPANGVRYDSFVYGQYFGRTIDGPNAIDEITRRAIEAIRALPDSVTLNDKAAVENARALYNQVVSAAQRALAEGGYDGFNYSEKLTNLENIIAYLTPPPGGEGPGSENEAGAGADPVVVTLSVLTALFGAAAIVAFVLLFIKSRPAKKTESAAAEVPADPAASEDSEQPEQISTEVDHEE